MPSFAGKVALITGASSPTGQAICSALRSESCALAMTYFQNETAAIALNTAYCGASDCMLLRMDVTKPESVQRAFSEVAKRFGKLDFLINIASFYRSHLWNVEPTSVSFDDWNMALSVDLTGSFLCAQLAIPLMKEAGHGRIINFGSSGSMRGDANTFAYNSAKGGLVGLTKSLARAYAPTITSNIIAPGSLESGWTERWALSDKEKSEIHALREMAKRHGSLSELAGLVCFLLSDGSSYINGQILYFDGGLST